MLIQKRTSIKYNPVIFLFLINSKSLESIKMTWNQSGSQDVGSDGAEDDCQDEEDDGVGVGCGCV